ncbi:MAG TPA: A24 family peptidase [Geminicoccaceae bacterium]|nr:A24 family peptidase [Geminicoccaceae bacterium]
MSLLLGLVLLILLGLAAWLDIDQRRIPNRIVAAIALLWLPYALHSFPARMPGSLATAAAVLALGMVVWRLRWIGGGDVKLIAALALWAGAKDTPLLLATIALSGGALALLWPSRLRHVAAWLSAALGARLGAMFPAPRAWTSTERGGTAQARSPAVSLPYGVAIAAGGCWLVHRIFIT